MATYKLVFTFSESNGSGFNEVYYTDEPNAKEAAALSTVEINSRLVLLHPLNTLETITASNVALARDTFLRPLNLAGLGQGFGSPVPVGDAVVLKLSAPGAGTRKLWMRGIPAAFYTRDGITGRDIVSPLLLSNLKFFFGQLQRAGLGMRKLTPKAAAPPSPYFPYPIFAVDGTIVPGASVITFNGPVFAPPLPARVILGGFNKKDLPGLNGHYSVLALGAGSITIPYITPGKRLVQSPGTVRLETYTGTIVFDKDACNFGYFGTRTSRNPLSRSRGARRAVRSRLSP